MAIAESWHVRSRGRECFATQRPFSNGETIVTALFPDTDSSGYIRRDFCVEGWKSHENLGEKPFSVWQTKYVAPSGNETVNPVEKLSAEEILQRLVEEDESHTENARFILAVMLERQKLLRETDSQRTPTGILRVYEHRKTGEVFIVKDPNIPLSEIESVQNEVFILLDRSGRTTQVESSSDNSDAVGDTEVEAELPIDEELGKNEGEILADSDVPDTEVEVELPENGTVPETGL